MSDVTLAHMQRLLAPYTQDLTMPEDALERLHAFLELLLRWNTRTNLTAVRAPEQLVQRQIGESLFAVHALEGATSLLDFGSGAGFPGIPLQIARPDLRVVLAESQGKKASFLREAVRVLALPSVVWAARVEIVTTEERFDAVVLRAVDDTEVALPAAAGRVVTGGCLLRYMAAQVPQEQTETLPGWHVDATWSVPQSQGRLVRFRRGVAIERASNPDSR